jgi:hypothetical protein
MYFPNSYTTKQSRKCSQSRAHPPATTTPNPHCKNVSIDAQAAPTANACIRCTAATRPRQRSARLRCAGSRRPPLSATQPQGEVTILLQRAHLYSLHTRASCARPPGCGGNLHNMSQVIMPFLVTEHRPEQQRNFPQQPGLTLHACHQSQREEVAGLSKEEWISSITFSCCTLLLFFDVFVRRAVLGNELQRPWPISSRPSFTPRENAACCSFPFCVVSTFLFPPLTSAIQCQLRVYPH